METVTDPPTYHDEKCEHVICQDCGKDLIQAYIEGIKDGIYKNVKITADVSYSQNKSSSILKMYNLSYDSSMPLYEDYLNNGGWDRSCKNKNVTTKIVTVSVCSPGVTWNKQIVDKKAYDEQVIVGYKCSCGEWKLVTNQLSGSTYNCTYVLLVFLYFFMFICYTKYVIFIRLWSFRKSSEHFKEIQKNRNLNLKA